MRGVQSQKSGPPDLSDRESSPVAPGSDVRIPPVAACLLLVLITLGIYWPVTSHGFVDYDDGEKEQGLAKDLRRVLGGGSSSRKSPDRRRDDPSDIDEVSWKVGTN